MGKYISGEASLNMIYDHYNNYLLLSKIIFAQAKYIIVWEADI